MRLNRSSCYKFWHKFLHSKNCDVILSIAEGALHGLRNAKLNGRMCMDKKKKLVAIVISAIISLIVSVTACCLGIPPEDLTGKNLPELSCTVQNF